MSGASPFQGTALVTGASSGIGEEFARQLAARGSNLILTARRQERLAALADELRETRRVSVEVVPADLTHRNSLAKLEERIGQEADLNLLVNNAGFGVSGTYTEQPIEKHQRMIDVHITAVVRLTHAAIPGMLRRGRGYIINVSSVAAFIPCGGGPGYTASKAYLNSFSTNLAWVVAPTVRIQALCPGYTYTEFHDNPDYRGRERETLPAWVWMPVDAVVRCSLERLEKGPVVVVPGFKNRLMAALLRSPISKSMMALRGRLLGKHNSSSRRSL